jgi:dihydrofolate synthase / folylpolyglutamate synthase
MSFYLPPDPILDEWAFNHVGLEFFKGGLERVLMLFEDVIAQVRERQQNGQLRLITVGGTNGKGETCYHLKWALEQQGHSVGMWTSPHVLSMRERYFFTEGHPSSDELLKTFEKFKNFCPQLSYYEFLFRSFLDLALERNENGQADIFILEVGLGGRLDSVNIFDPDLSLLTGVALDHTSILGETLKEILCEKREIARSTKPFVTAIQDEELRESLKQWSEEREIPWHDIFENDERVADCTYSKRNRFLALSGLEQLFQEDLVSRWDRRLMSINDLAQNYGPGRWQKMTSFGRGFIFIGSHNENGLDEMLRTLEGEDPPLALKHVDHALVAFSDRKKREVKGSMELLEQSDLLKESLIYSTYQHPKALSFERLKNCFGELKKRGKLVKDWKSYIENETQVGDIILCTGSYYFLGNIQQWLWDKKVFSKDSTSSTF